MISLRTSMPRRTDELSLQIFELEDSDIGDMDESALDMSDAGPVPPVDIRQRRMSTASRRPRASNASTQSVTSRPSPPASPLKAERSGSGSGSSPAGGHIPLPRARLTSVITRSLEGAQSAPSPLAQVFQPLNVTDEQLEPDQPLDGLSPPTVSPDTHN